MRIINFFAYFLLLWQLNIIFGSANQYVGDDLEKRAVNKKLLYFVSWFKEDEVVNLLRSEEAKKVEGDTLIAAISAAAWEELEKAIEELLKHPKCKLEELQGFYANYKESFWGETKTKTMLKKKIVELGGKDPDALSEDEDGIY